MQQGGASLSLVFCLIAAGISLWLLAALMRQRRKGALLLMHRETQLGEQQRQLAQLSRLVVLAELSAGIAHDIYQPLTAILVNAKTALELAARECIDHIALRETLDDILTSNQHAIGIVRRLRGLLHSERVPQSSIDLNEAARAALALARADLLRNGIKVDTDLTGHLRPTVGDPVQIQRVILNLLVNACEAMADRPQGERQLHVATRVGPCPTEIRLIVTDSGGGIDPQQLEKVFQPFVTTKRDGLGLGLSICRSIVETHGGRIWAENLAWGASFHVTLPSSG